MAKNKILRPRTLLDIDNKVERVLLDLSRPEPPLDLNQVRELLRLDLGYYTADDPSLARKVASRIWVGTQQVFKRPTLLIDIIRNLDIRGFYVPDEKRIFIDKSQPTPKHRWLEAHEIGHSLLPWHNEVMFGDSASTLTPDCHHTIEAEANFAAGRLLFLRETFTERALDYEPSLKALKDLKPQFGNSYTTTFWRCVETWGKELPIVGLITAHPHTAKRPADFDPCKPCRYVIQSPAFAEQFSSIGEIELYKVIERYCTQARGGPLGSAEVELIDDNHERHIFHFETFSYIHDILTLGIYSGKRKIIF